MENCKERGVLEDGVMKDYNTEDNVIDDGVLQA